MRTPVMDLHIYDPDRLDQQARTRRIIRAAVLGGEVILVILIIAVSADLGPFRDHRLLDAFTTAVLLALIIIGAALLINPLARGPHHALGRRAHRR